MNVPPFTGDDEFDLNSLRLAFPSWRIARASGQWWASRGPVLSESRTAADAIQAATPEALFKALRARDQ